MSITMTTHPHTHKYTQTQKAKMTMSNAGHGLPQELGGEGRGLDKGTGLWEGVLTACVLDWLKGCRRI